MRLLRLFRDPHTGKYFKIFVVTCVLWFLLSGIDIHGWRGGWDEPMTYKISFFGLDIHTFETTNDYNAYYWYSPIYILIRLLSAVAIICLVLIVARYAIPGIKKKWESI